MSRCLYIFFCKLTFNFACQIAQSVNIHSCQKCYSACTYFSVTYHKRRNMFIFPHLSVFMIIYFVLRTWFWLSQPLPVEQSKRWSGISVDTWWTPNCKGVSSFGSPRNDQRGWPVRSKSIIFSQSRDSVVCFLFTLNNAFPLPHNRAMRGWLWVTLTAED